MTPSSNLLSRFGFTCCMQSDYYRRHHNNIICIMTRAFYVRLTCKEHGDVRIRASEHKNSQSEEFWDVTF